MKTAEEILIQHFYGDDVDFDTLMAIEDYAVNFAEYIQINHGNGKSIIELLEEFKNL